MSLTRTFQTNATLVVPEWCHYFVETNARVGVSIDGPQSIHDANRKLRSGKGSFDGAMRGVRQLREHKIELNGLAVLTPVSLKQPEAIFEFFVQEGFANVGFNIEETEGEHRQSRLPRRPETRELFMRFMERFLELNMAHGNPVTVREAKAVMYYLMMRSSSPDYAPDEPEMEAGRIITISRSGEIFTWSPELASGVNDDELHFSLGNVFDVSSVDEAMDGAKACAIQAEIDRGRNSARAPAVTSISAVPALQQTEFL